MAITILEALRESVVIPDVSDKAFEKALIDAGLVGTDNYTAGNKETVNQAAVALLRSLPIQSISEGGFSITFDRNAINDNINVLLGVDKVTRGIERISI